MTQQIRFLFGDGLFICPHVFWCQSHMDELGPLDHSLTGSCKSPECKKSWGQSSEKNKNPHFILEKQKLHLQCKCKLVLPATNAEPLEL